MENIIMYILLGLIIIYLIVFGILFWKKIKTTQEQTLNPPNQDNQPIINQLNDTRNTLQTKFDKQQQDLNNQFNEMLVQLTEINKENNKLDTINSTVQNLTNVFVANNKVRGNVGEYLLEKLLSDMYGESQNLYETQYKMPDGNVVDAIIKTPDNKENIIIDSKFPIINYNNYLSATDKTMKNEYLKKFKTDFKSKIDEVSKYIKKQNNVTNAIMFVPSESVFSFVYSEFQEDVIKYSFQKNVWLVSPTTLSAILFVLDKYLKDYNFTHNLNDLKTKIINTKTEFDRWATRFNKLSTDIEKVYQDTNDLKTTHSKIYNNYDKIINLKDSEN